MFYRCKGGIMARPKRCRRICKYPDYWSFGPDDDNTGAAVVLTLDEYETIRLIDFEKWSQAKCAEQMDVARTTVTAIYENARYKLSDALVNGKRIVIAGGEYRLQSEMKIPDGIVDKGGNIMRIAVTYDNGNGEIFQHFGHTEQFMLYDVEDGAIVKQEPLDTVGSGHGALAGLLLNTKVDALICGGIGGGARKALAEAGIGLYPGAKGSADEAVKAMINGTLEYDPDTECTHHGHGHGHGEGHRCHRHGEGHPCDGGSCHE